MGINNKLKLINFKSLLNLMGLRWSPILLLKGISNIMQALWAWSEEYKSYR